MAREIRVAVLTTILLVTGVFTFELGWHVAGILLVVVALAAIAAYLALVIMPARVPRRCLLEIRLSGPIREQQPSTPIQMLRGQGFPAMQQLRQALEAAATDPAVDTVMVELSGVECGLATAQEIYGLLARLRERGKRVVAVLDGDSTGPREYLIAAAAGEIVVNPDTGFMMLGLAAGGLFVKGALDKAEIGAQTLQWKEYKGAAETFSREHMSEPLRESLQALLNDWEQTMVDCVSRGRKIPLEQAQALINAGFLSTRAAIDCRLCDRVGYAQEIRTSFDPTDKGKRLITLSRYLKRVRHREGGRRRARIAVIYGTGPVIVGDGPAGSEFMSGDGLSREFSRAGRDPKVRAIVFRVNSPGGSAVGSDLIWRAVSEARERGKPVVVSMGDVAASGGYYVAMAADAIVAEPTTVTGSIGVVYAKFNLASPMARLGINVDAVKTSQSGDALSPTRGLTEPELHQLNEVMGDVYQNFTNKMAHARRLDAEHAEQLARGRVWSGTAAKAHGLIDELGPMAKAVALARERAGLAPTEPHQLVSFAAPGFMGLRLALLPAQINPTLEMIVEQAFGVPRRWVAPMLQMLTHAGVLLLSSVW